MARQKTKKLQKALEATADANAPGQEQANQSKGPVNSNNGSLIDALVKNKQKAHPRAKDVVDHQLVDTDVEGYVHRMEAETGAKVITPDLLPREALHYVSESSDNNDTASDFGQTQGQNPPENAQGTKMGKKGTLRRGDPGTKTGGKAHHGTKDLPALVQRPEDALGPR